MPTTAKCVTFTDELEIQGPMSLNVTLPISSTAHAVAQRIYFRF